MEYWETLEKENFIVDLVSTDVSNHINVTNTQYTRKVSFHTSHRVIQTYPNAPRLIGFRIVKSSILGGWKATTTKKTKLANSLITSHFFFNFLEKFLAVMFSYISSHLGRHNHYSLIKTAKGDVGGWCGGGEGFTCVPQIKS